jgi:hypothetical protein
VQSAGVAMISPFGDKYRLSCGLPHTAAGFAISKANTSKQAAALMNGIPPICCPISCGGLPVSVNNNTVEVDRKTPAVGKSDKAGDSTIYFSHAFSIYVNECPIL